MLLNGKEYKIGKITRAKNKRYTEVYNKVQELESNGKLVTDELLDEMVEVLVDIYDNQFSVDEVNDEWDIGDIIIGFATPQLEMNEKMNKRVNEIEKKFKTKKK